MNTLEVIVMEPNFVEAAFAMEASMNTFSQGCVGSVGFHVSKSMAKTRQEEANKQTRRIETEHSFICPATNEAFQG